MHAPYVIVAFKIVSPIIIIDNISELGKQDNYIATYNMVTMIFN